jgi:ATP-dependent Clp protease adaptor protein ClpS
MFLSQLNMGVLSNHQLRLNKEDDDYHHDHGDNLLAQEAKPVVKKPPMYKVIMLNEDYTPMEFVVYALESFFGMGAEQATKVMLQVHTEGKAICGVYTKDIAETKAAQVNQCAVDNEHPLLCEIDALEED